MRSMETCRSIGSANIAAPLPCSVASELTTSARDAMINTVSAVLWNFMIAMELIVLLVSLTHLPVETQARVVYSLLDAVFADQRSSSN